MRKHFRKLFAALAFATLGPLGCVVGDTADPAAVDDQPELEDTYLWTDSCTRNCDLYGYYCLWYPQRCPGCDQTGWTAEGCIHDHQQCLLACPPPPQVCACQNGSWCCTMSDGRLECGAQGTCSGDDGGDGGGGGGSGGGGCSNDWDCSPIDECSDSGSCVPLGCG